MRVRAISQSAVENGPAGHFDGLLRYGGQVFDIPDSPKRENGMPMAFSEAWMEQVHTATPRTPSPKAKDEDEKPKRFVKPEKYPDETTRAYKARCEKAKADFEAKASADAEEPPTGAEDVLGDEGE